MASQRFDGARWQEYVTTFVRPDFEQFGNVVKTRILPVFDRIKEEADAVAHERYRELLKRPGDPDYWDAGDVADAAMQDGFTHYEMLTSMRWATIGLYSAGLYHLTEQHLVDLRVRILDKYQRDEVKMEEIFRWYKEDLSLDVKKLPSWPVISEVRLVANVVKHADGRSAQELEKLRPDLFDPLQIRNVPGVRFVGRRIRTPGFGQELYVGPEDFSRYHDASAAFWTEIAHELPMLST